MQPDGITFKLSGVYINKMPDNLINAGIKLNYASLSVKLYPVLGLVIQKESGTFKFTFDRQGACKQCFYCRRRRRCSIHYDPTLYPSY
jgi:hypothetical protein